MQAWYLSILALALPTLPMAFPYRAVSIQLARFIQLRFYGLAFVLGFRLIATTCRLLRIDFLRSRGH